MDYVAFFCEALNFLNPPREDSISTPPGRRSMSDIGIYRQLKARRQFTVIRELAVLAPLVCKLLQPRGCLSLSVLVWIGVSDPLAHSRPFPCHWDSCRKGGGCAKRSVSLVLSEASDAGRR
jgi:hypothetical protein